MSIREYILIYRYMYMLILWIPIEIFTFLFWVIPKPQNSEETSSNAAVFIVVAVIVSIIVIVIVIIVARRIQQKGYSSKWVVSKIFKESLISFLIIICMNLDCGLCMFFVQEQIPIVKMIWTTLIWQYYYINKIPVYLIQM